jgi:hypothetical protein
LTNSGGDCSSCVVTVLVAMVFVIERELLSSALTLFDGGEFGGELTAAVVMLCIPRLIYCYC